MTPRHAVAAAERVIARTRGRLDDAVVVGRNDSVAQVVDLGRDQVFVTKGDAPRVVAFARPWVSAADRAGLGSGADELN
jgi:hypothetical protein